MRDIYRPASPSRDDMLLLVAGDEVSAFDRMLDSHIPGKGRELTLQSRWWQTRLHTPSHVDDLPPASALPPVPDALCDRSTIVRRLDMIPVECVARGYLVGSAWLEYKTTGRVGQRRLRAGLSFGDRLEEPVFTPTTKAPPGSADQPVSLAELRDQLGELASELAELTLAAYRRAEIIARTKGLLIADTKFEFGIDPTSGAVLLADEVLTGDSSRPMDSAEWDRGRVQFYGKELIRRWLRAQPRQGTPIHCLPIDVVDTAAQSYRALTTTLYQSG